VARDQFNETADALAFIPVVYFSFYLGVTVVDQRAFATELARAHAPGAGGQGDDFQPTAVRAAQLSLHNARQQGPFFAGYRFTLAGKTAELLQTQTGHAVRQLVRYRLQNNYVRDARNRRDFLERVKFETPPSVGLLDRSSLRRIRRGGT